jgi:Ca-activated chloride channel family protein
MSFEHSELLALLVVALPLAVWGLLRQEHRRRVSLRVFGDPVLLSRGSSLPPEQLSRVRDLLRVAALGLGLLALARPQFGERSSPLAQSGRDLLVLLDLSRSMNAAAREGSRLGTAKRMVGELLATSPGDRVGLVVFGGSAFLQLPLTHDHAAFLRYLDAASTDDLADPATDLSRALATAAAAFEHEGERGARAVLLLSDGESVRGYLDPAIARLRQNGIPVVAVGIGTLEGAPVPADSATSVEPWHRDHIGRIVHSRLEEAELRRVARETNGAYLHAGAASGPAVRSALARVGQHARSSPAAPQPAEQFQWPLGLAVILVAAEPLISLAMRRRLRRIPMRLALLLAMLVGCGTAAYQAREAERAYHSGRFAEAYAGFQRALAAGGDPALEYSLGNAFYRLKRYEDAVRSFRRGTEIPRIRQRSYYNLGNAYVRISEESSNKDEPLRQAIAAYEQALRLDPADSAAKWNLELALRRRGSDRESGGSAGRGRSADYGRGDMNVPGYEGNEEAAVGAMAGGGYGAGEGESVEELTEAQARQLLEAVEREQLSSHPGRQAGISGGGQLDW